MTREDRPRDGVPDPEPMTPEQFQDLGADLAAERLLIASRSARSVTFDDVNAVAALMRLDTERAGGLMGPGLARTLMVVGAGLLLGSAAAFALAPSAEAGVVPRIAAQATVSPTPTATASAEPGVTGTATANVTFIKQSGPCRLASAFSDRLRFDAANGALTVTQLSNGHVSRGTVRPTGEWETSAPGQGYRGRIEGTVLQGQHTYTTDGCNEVYNITGQLSSRLIGGGAAALPSFGPIRAVLSPPSTTYSVEVSNPAELQLTFQWSNTTTCGGFLGNGPRAIWEHPHPPCSEEPVHPGTIQVRISGPDVACTGTYTGGSATGTGGGTTCGGSRPPLVLATASAAPSGALVPGVGGGVVTTGGGSGIPGGPGGGILVGGGLLLGGVLVQVRRRCDCHVHADAFRKQVLIVEALEKEIEKTNAGIEKLYAQRHRWREQKLVCEDREVEWSDFLDNAGRIVGSWAAYIAALEAQRDGLVDRIALITSLMGGGGGGFAQDYDTKPHDGWIQVSDTLWAKDEKAAERARNSQTIMSLLAGAWLGPTGGWMSALTIAQTNLMQCVAKLIDARAKLRQAEEAIPAARDILAQIPGRLSDADKALRTINEQIKADQERVELITTTELPAAKAKLEELAETLNECNRSTPPQCPPGVPVVDEYELADADEIEDPPVPPAAPGPLPEGPPSGTSTSDAGGPSGAPPAPPPGASPPGTPAAAPGGGGRVAGATAERALQIEREIERNFERIEKLEREATDGKRDLNAEEHSERERLLARNAHLREELFTAGTSERAAPAPDAPAGPPGDAPPTLSPEAEAERAANQAKIDEIVQRATTQSRDFNNAEIEQMEQLEARNKDLAEGAPPAAAGHEREATFLLGTEQRANIADLQRERDGLRERIEDLDVRGDADAEREATELRTQERELSRNISDELAVAHNENVVSAREAEASAAREAGTLTHEEVARVAELERQRAIAVAGLEEIATKERTEGLTPIDEEFRVKYEERIPRLDEQLADAKRDALESAERRRTEVLAPPAAQPGAAGPPARPGEPLPQDRPALRELASQVRVMEDRLAELMAIDEPTDAGREEVATLRKEFRATLHTAATEYAASVARAEAARAAASPPAPQPAAASVVRTLSDDDVARRYAAAPKTLSPEAEAARDATRTRLLELERQKAAAEATIADLESRPDRTADDDRRLYSLKQTVLGDIPAQQSEAVGDLYTRFPELAPAPVSGTGEREPGAAGRDPGPLEEDLARAEATIEELERERGRSAERDAAIDAAETALLNELADKYPGLAMPPTDTATPEASLEELIEEFRRDYEQRAAAVREQALTVTRERLRIRDEQHPLVDLLSSIGMQVEPSAFAAILAEITATDARSALAQAALGAADRAAPDVARDVLVVAFAAASATRATVLWGAPTPGSPLQARLVERLAELALASGDLRTLTTALTTVRATDAQLRSPRARELIARIGQVFPTAFDIERVVAGLTTASRPEDGDGSAAFVRHTAGQPVAPTLLERAQELASIIEGLASLHEMTGDTGVRAAIERLRRVAAQYAIALEQQGTGIARRASEAGEQEEAARRTYEKVRDTRLTGDWTTLWTYVEATPEEQRLFDTLIPTWRRWLEVDSVVRLQGEQAASQLEGPLQRRWQDFARATRALTSEAAELERLRLILATAGLDAQARTEVYRTTFEEAKARTSLFERQLAESRVTGAGVGHLSVLRARTGTAQALHFTAAPAEVEAERAAIRTELIGLDRDVPNPDSGTGMTMRIHTDGLYERLFKLDPEGLTYTAAAADTATVGYSVGDLVAPIRLIFDPGRSEREQNELRSRLNEARIVRDRIAYLQQRRVELAMIDGQSYSRLRSELDQDMRYFEHRKPWKELAWLSRDLVSEPVFQMTQQAFEGEAPFLAWQLAGVRDDPREFARFLVTLQRTKVARGDAAWQAYIDTPWYRRGAWEQTWKIADQAAMFEQMYETDTRLLLALEGMASGGIETLPEDLRELLRRNGFIARDETGSERYAIPQRFQWDAASVGERASAPNAVDQWLNLSAVGQLAATFYLGAGAGALARLWALEAGTYGMAASFASQVAIEATLFTALDGLARGGNPFAVIAGNTTLGQFGKDWLHTAAVIGGLHAIAPFGEAYKTAGPQGVRDLIREVRGTRIRDPRVALASAPVRTLLERLGASAARNAREGVVLTAQTGVAVAVDALFGHKPSPESIVRTLFAIGVMHSTGAIGRPIASAAREHAADLLREAKQGRAMYRTGADAILARAAREGRTQLDAAELSRLLELRERVRESSGRVDLELDLARVEPEVSSARRDRVRERTGALERSTGEPPPGASELPPTASEPPPAGAREADLSVTVDLPSGAGAEGSGSFGRFIGLPKMPDAAQLSEWQAPPIRGEGSRTPEAVRAQQHELNLTLAERYLDDAVAGGLPRDLPRDVSAQTYVAELYRQYQEAISGLRRASELDGPNYWEHFSPESAAAIRSRLEYWQRTGRPLPEIGEIVPLVERAATARASRPTTPEVRTGGSSDPGLDAMTPGAVPVRPASSGELPLTAKEPPPPGARGDPGQLP